MGSLLQHMTAIGIGGYEVNRLMGDGGQGQPTMALKLLFRTCGHYLVNVTQNSVL